MSLEIRLATLEDAPLVHRIMREAFAEYDGLLNPPSGANSETVTDVEQAMREGGAVLARQNQVAVGAGRFLLEPDHFYVGRVAVLPQHRGAGIGRALMDFLEGVAAEHGLETIRLGVRMSLPQNLAFYGKLGYSVMEIAQHPRGADQVATLAKSIRRTG